MGSRGTERSSEAQDARLRAEGLRLMALSGLRPSRSRRRGEGLPLVFEADRRELAEALSLEP